MNTILEITLILFFSKYDAQQFQLTTIIVVNGVYCLKFNLTKPLYMPGKVVLCQHQDKALFVIYLQTRTQTWPNNFPLTAEGALPQCHHHCHLKINTTNTVTRLLQIGTVVYTYVQVMLSVCYLTIIQSSHKCCIKVHSVKINSFWVLPIYKTQLEDKKCNLYMSKQSKWQVFICKMYFIKNHCVDLFNLHHLTSSATATWPMMVDR